MTTSTQSPVLNLEVISRLFSCMDGMDYCTLLCTSLLQYLNKIEIHYRVVMQLTSAGHFFVFHSSTFFRPISAGAAIKPSLNDK